MGKIVKFSTIKKWDIFRYPNVPTKYVNVEHRRSYYLEGDGLVHHCRREGHDYEVELLGQMKFGELVNDH